MHTVTIWMHASQTRDPDGNVVYFDTTDPELIEPGDAGRATQVLTGACRQLRDLNADCACIDAVREVLAALR